MNNSSHLIKFLILFLILPLFACVPKEEGSQIRIVDLQGKARKLTTRYPELNVPALNSQGQSYEKTSQSAFANSIKVSSSPTYVKKSTPVREVFAEEPNPNRAFVTSQTQQNSGFTDSGIANGVAAGSEFDEVIEYDLSNAADVIPTKREVKKEVKKKLAKPQAKKIKKYVTTKGKYFAQVGSFLSKSRATDALQKMEKFHAGNIRTSTGARTLHRVWLGPFSSKSKARAMVKKITNSGNAAILVKDK
jgi:cell division protein FtsN